MVTLDADIAGCIQTWLDSSSDLDAKRQEVLRSCLDDLDRVLPRLNDPEEVDYYQVFESSRQPCSRPSTAAHSSGDAVIVIVIVIVVSSAPVARPAACAGVDCRTDPASFVSDPA